MTTLRWLHFTDLHIDRPDDARRQLAGDLFLEDLKRVTRKLGPWDVVLFTGDLAYSGREEQYKLLDQELGRIWGVFRDVHPTAARLPYLLAVPGNHDLARPAKGNAIASGLVHVAAAREALWSGEADNIKPVRDWFAAYAKWWKRCKLRPPSGIEDGLLPGDFAYVLEKDDAKFGFVGMNSAFLDLSDEVDEGGLWMDARQIQPACGGNLGAWIERCNLAFLLTHHPPAWFAKESRDRENPVFLTEKHFAAHLCGHLHEALFETRRLGGGDARRIWQAASLFGVQKLPGGDLDRKYGYTAGHLELSAESARVTTWPRLAARLQDGSHRFTADFTFALEDDLAHSRAEALPVRSISMAAPVPMTTAAVTPPAPSTWAEAVERSPLWQVLASQNAARATALKQLATDIARAAWSAWEQAEKALPGDPWRDDRYPLRVLDRLALLVAPDDPGPEETLILVVAPFVREAILAAGAVWMASADPLDLEGRGSAAEPRNTLEQVHRSREDLVRHAGRLAGEARDAVGFWMMEQALQRSPHLWNRKPQELFRVIERHRAAGAHAWLDFERLLRLARAVGVNPDALDAEGGIAREAEEITVGGVHLRVPALAYLLCVAGWQALDLREADEVAVDHVGRDAGSTPAILRDALRNASWLARDDRHLLAHACPHPVVDFVLRELVERADAALERTRARFDAAPQGPFALLRRLPKRLAADEVRPARAADGRPLYALPHVRFRLDHNRIRELLMGEQLYGNPTLAIRELYQNALDACRYRRARGEYLERTGNPAHQPYEGCIAFRQDIDERGRTYIECTDNGVGMTRNVLERVFAVAGRRFHDMPDFIEERAAWQRCKPPIELYPNSQFGVGVLSYFMLADEVTVWTRRYEADGELGEPLVVHISSASGLFRLEEGREEEMPEAGTRLRLYLASATYNGEYGVEEQVSCLSGLGELLWVAEFATSAVEGGERLDWKPGELTQHRPRDNARRSIRPTKDPDVWWCAGGKGLLLCDGLATETDGDCAIANLHGSHFPEMSVDRKNVRKWDEAWLGRALEESWQTLVDWKDLDFHVLWYLEQISVCSARKLVEVIKQQDPSIWHASDDRKLIKLQNVGCCVLDRDILEPRSRGHMDPKSTADYSIIAAWRMMSWAKAGRFAQFPADWPSSSLLDETRHLVAAPGDVLLLSSSLKFYNQKWLIRDRYNAWHEGEVPIPHIFFAALKLGIKPSEVLFRIAELAPLGIRPPPVDTSALDHLAVTEIDLRLLSRNLDGEDPWLNSNISTLHVLRATWTLDLPAQSILDRLIHLASLGIKLPPVDASALDAFKLTHDDLPLLSEYDDIIGRRSEGEVTSVSIFNAAAWLNMEPAKFLQRLERFVPFGVKLPRFDAEVLDRLEMSEDERLLMSRDLDGHSPWIIAPASLMHLTRATRKLHRSLSDILTMAVRLGIASDELRLHAEMLGNAPPDKSDERLYTAFYGIAAPDAATAFERGKERARYRFWYLSQEQFEARLERFRPLIEASLRERFPPHQPPRETGKDYA